MENLKFAKIRKVKSPTRANPTDAGIDLYVPEDLMLEEMKQKFQTVGCTLPMSFNDDKTIKEFTIRPNQSILIPSGIKFNIPDGWALIAFNKSGVAAKKGLLVGSCVTGNTIIITNKGKFTAITLTNDFCKKHNIKVLSRNISENKDEFCNFDGFRPVVKSLCIRVTFDDGTIIEGDENHLIYINGSWKALKEL